MSTRLTKKLTYDAPVEAVAAMLDQVAFREEVLQRQKVSRGSAEIDGDVVTLTQARSADDLPSFARKLVGDEIVIVHRETWTSPSSAKLELSIPGKPGEAVGTLDLSEAGGTTTEVVNLEVSVRIPFVGGKIEALIAGMFERALDVEQRVGAEWLARG